MALPASADVRLLLSRIRPGASFGWKGGSDSDHTQVVWRDAAQAEPSEAEYLTEHTAVSGENTTRQQTRQAIRARALPAVGKAIADLTNQEFRAAVELDFFNRGNIDRDGLLRPLNQWR
jgi:hypothetical protein